MKQSVLTLVLTSLITIHSVGQSSVKWTNSSYRYYSRPGFVNISEIHGAIGLGDTNVDESRYYAGLSNVFGYQINRHFLQGAGIGLFYYGNRVRIPVYLDIRNYKYLKRSTIFVVADGGLILDPNDLNHGTKIFVNPALGINRSFSNVLEGTFSGGVSLQMGDNLPRTSFLNIKVGLIFKKNSFKMIKPSKSKQ